MKTIKQAALGIYVSILCISCGFDNEAEMYRPERPYDPWIVRSVLDGQPRMITLALHDDLWVAYNTGTCALYKAWKGRVNFEGAVFTTAHGPQPVSVGDAYIENSFARPWSLRRGDDDLPVNVHYLGHRMRDGHAELMYELRTADAVSVKVYEMVEYAVSPSGQNGLSRTFTTEGVPADHQVVVRTNISSVASKHNVVTDTELVQDRVETMSVNGRQLLDIDARLMLSSNGESRLVVYFVDDPAIPNAYQPEEGDPEDLPFGYRLIAQSDCKTCHNTNVQTIGPSYVAVAERYANTDENVNMLARKVINGGGGIWGAQIMSPHPNLEESDARAMVQWILDLDEDEEQTPETEGSSLVLKPVDVEEEDLVQGAITEIFALDDPLALPGSKPSGNPSMAGVMPRFANLRNADFVGLTDDFAIYAEGFLKFENEGVYTIRLWSDDGSMLFINDQVIIDHDGVHGTSYEEIDISVQEGLYAFRLEYFNATGDKFLSLNWKPKGAGEFQTIPAEAYFHDSAERARLSGKALPMSVSSSIPGDRSVLTSVHPSYDLQMARPYEFLPKVGGMDFLNDGRLVICTWDPTGSVYILDNVASGEPAEITVTRIAEGLAEPLGLKVVDDEIYVLQKQELTHLVDTDGDDLVDEYRNVSNAWQTSGNFHEFAFGLEYRDGYFYGNLATAIQPGGASAGPQIPDRGKVMKIDAATGQVEFLASGLRTPNGIGFGVDGELFISDNQGDWLPASKILHVKKGAWFGSRSVDYDGTAGLQEQPPVVWLPQDEIGNSPSTPLAISDGPYAGQMIHGEVTHGGVKRVFVEKIDGDYQGCVFRFIQGLEAGVNRMTWGPDGALYVGGIGNPGNWAQTGKLWYGLQRLAYNGQPTFEMLAVRARSNGVEIEFTEPLDPMDGWNPSNFDVHQWQYIPTANYGGPKEDFEKLPVRSASLSDDGRRVFLELAGMKERRVVYIHLNKHFVSLNGRQLWSTEAWYTMNNIPAGRPGVVRRAPALPGNNQLSDHEREQGWKLLFDGRSLDEFHRFGKSNPGSSWVVENGAIKLDAEMGDDGRWVVQDRGDLVTNEEYEDFELRLEWKISNCGNSGIMHSVVESDAYSETWQTGPEMQILDNTCHPDARFSTHKAGDLYDMVESRYVTVRPAGQWNEVRLVKKDGIVQHWLNGIMVVQYEYGGSRWDRMVSSSKFADMPGFGKAQRGHIALQDHGDAQVWFRNIRIREFD